MSAPISRVPPWNFRKFLESGIILKYFYLHIVADAACWLSSLLGHWLDTCKCPLHVWLMLRLILITSQHGDLEQISQENKVKRHSIFIIKLWEYHGIIQSYFIGWRSYRGLSIAMWRVDKAHTHYIITYYERNIKTSLRRMCYLGKCYLLQKVQVFTIRLIKYEYKEHLVISHLEIQ